MYILLLIIFPMVSDFKSAKIKQNFLKELIIILLNKKIYHVNK